MEQSFCAGCYATVSKLLFCWKCRKRCYCSQDCQRRDWKQASHKYWCGTSGENGFDLAIRPFGDKGLGVVALRTFHRNDIIMMERLILKLDNDRDFVARIDQVEQAPQPAALALAQQSGDFPAKFQTNCMGCTDPDGGSTVETGLFLTMSRINHDCLGNAEHLFLEHRRVKILVACRTILSGEEVSISYVDFRSNYEGRRGHLLECYNFACQCCVCTDPGIGADVAKMKSLDGEILQLGSVEMADLALRKGELLLKLYDKHHISSCHYHRTYYDLFQIAVTKRKTLAAAQKFIRQSYESALAFTHDAEYESVSKMKKGL